MNILGHKFRFIQNGNDGNDVVQFICDKCKVDVDKWSSGEIKIWHNKIRGYSDLISCDEIIIKNIIE